uniref:Breast cancer anti-estrogen resistance protein 3-like n=1 Tax=Actinia tenebrosa TaxID=6105 RepID=A0A6P8HSG9_ACTTE
MSGKKNIKLSRSFPARVKNENKSRQPLPFKRFADFLTLKRKKKKDDGSSSLDKQAWFHGKINAEYAEMVLKKNGEFLVREDPAMPGACFIAVRTKETALHLAINKLKSSKGTRFKYRIEDSDFVFDSISELIRFYVNERRPVSIRPPAVITIAVSREAALLSEEDFRGRFSTAGSARINRATRKLERKSSDPILSKRVPSKLYEEIDAQDILDTLDTPETPVLERTKSSSDPPSVSVDDTAAVKIAKNRKLEELKSNSAPRSRSLDNVLDSSLEAANCTYDSPRTMAIPTRVHSNTPYSQQEKKRKNLDKSYFETDTDYAVPSSIPLPDNDEEMSHNSSDIVYDVPPSKPSLEKKRSCDEKTTYMNQIDVSNALDNVTQSQEKTQDGRHNIYLTVVKKLRDKLIQPFLQQDCVTLASHLTKADLELVWKDSEDPEDEDGGAKGLERLVLPQGREKRCALLERYQNLTYWVGSLVIAAGEMASRAQMVTKLIEMADILSDKQGNLVSFMAIIDGLALPQVSRLHHTWSCLQHQYSKSATLFHSTLKPLAELLLTGAPSPFPGVCLPYVVPLSRLLETTSEADLEEWHQDKPDQGLEIMLAHLTSGRTVIQQIETFKEEATKKMNLREEKPDLNDYFRKGINIGDLLGVHKDPVLRTQKLKTLLNWLSENAEQGNKQAP